MSRSSMDHSETKKKRRQEQSMAEYEAPQVESVGLVADLTLLDGSDVGGDDDN